MTWQPRLPGRRGASLLVLGLAYGLIGFGYVAVGELPAASRLALSLALAIAPIQVWGVVWMLCAGFAFVSVYWPPGRDQWGFVPLAAITTAWACVYFSSWLVYDAPRAWVGGATWLAMNGLLAIIAGWPEQPAEGGESAEA